MSVVNRKNVALGLAAYKLTKSLRSIRHQPEPEPEPPPKKKRGRKIGVLVVGAAVAAGAVAFLRSR